MKVRNVIISKQGKNSENYERLKKIVTKKNINIILAEQEKQIQIDKYVYFNIIFPTDQLIEENTLNNNSIVAKLCYGNFSMLFTGDVEKIAEQEMIEKYKNTNTLRATILKVAHHGSKSSSIEEFLKLVQAKIALIGVGEKNTFGHPNDAVLKRIEKLGTNIYRTDQNGEIEIKIDKKGNMKIKTKINL